MKKLIFLLSLLLASSFISAQTVIFTDDFESYNTTETIPSQTTNWQTWSGGTTGIEAAFVSEVQVHSASKSMHIVEGNDMIYDFGGITTGQWETSVWIYTPAGKTGYINIMHVFGAEWAFECYFENGVLRIENGQETPTYPYPVDTWVHLVFTVDLDTDEAVLNLDGVDLAIWPYSNLASGGTFSNPKLDVINFYSAAGFEFFVDDFTFKSLNNTYPVYCLDIYNYPIHTNGIDAIEFAINNICETELLYIAYPIFDDPSTSSNLVASTMNYDGENTSAIGWQESYELYAAVRFQNDQTSMHVGQEIESVDIYINDLPVGDITVYVWSKGGFITPGASTVLSEKTVTPVAHSWNTVTLTTPVRVTGDEIWVGYKFSTPVGGNTLGTDDATLIPTVNYLKTDAIWDEYIGIGNFNIRANVTGAGWPVWLSVSPQEGIIYGEDCEYLTLDFNTSGLPTGTYNASAVIGSNDPGSEWNEVPIVLDFVSGIDNVTKIGVMTYPNPATQNINVVSDASISSISVYSVTGQFINSFQVNATSTSIDVASMQSGMYEIEINTGNEIVKSKFVVK